ncbi:hypothetical protein HNO88_000078 [Novosphingobium chloroacetimidivorans]|uniref:Tetratricopeptide repeat protein n=1 Tax=Novosphingobium chloroacetimidivorans TaxID=1428314 RepID=A0A7W7K5Y6_9SPHN|nr:hypothetical protein [Novosphingobium chloroacetimidivorans]MBB4856781.1 hypothetical protein [Novosphingobium chloroacetimidivorans]
MARKFLISRVALAVALSSGVAASFAPAPAFAAKKEKAAGGSFSKEFSAAAAELDKAVGAANTTPAVKAASDKAAAAKDPAAKTAAAAEVDAALGGADAKLAAAAAVASTPLDKIKLGELTRNIGVLKSDPAMQHKGLVAMINSGAAQPDSVGQLQYLAGVTAYQTGDYAGAIQYLKPSYDGGYRDQQGMIDKILADAYKRTNNSGAALQLAQGEIAKAKAAGTKPSDGAIRTALQAAYDAKQAGPATDLSAQLVEYYPTPESWKSAFQVTRAVNRLGAQENLDLMRLMARTNSLSSKGDYLSYVQDADPRRLPGETLKIIDRGVSSGVLTAGDVAEYRTTAQGRVTADRNSLASYEKDARASGTFASTNGAADAYLSYDQPAKAEELYKLALSKAPATEKERVLTRLGIAQADQGKYAEAQSTFAQVTSPTRAPVAKLWTAYVKGKANPAAPTAAAPGA